MASAPVVARIPSVAPSPSGENKRATPVVAPAKVHKITSCKEVGRIVEKFFEHISDIPVADFNALAYGANVLVVDVNTVFVDDAILEERIDELGGADCKIRGPTKKIGETTFTAVEPDIITQLSEFAKKGMKVVFISDQSDKAEDTICKQLRAFGITAPQVWCTNGAPKGLYVKHKLPGLDGGLLFALGDTYHQLQTYVSAMAFKAKRVVLIQYMTYEA